MGPGQVRWMGRGVGAALAALATLYPLPTLAQHAPSPMTVVVSTPIALPAAANGFGVANPYPLNIPVSGLQVVGTATLRVRIRGFTHTRPGDVSLLLVSPSGATTFLMSDPISGSVSDLDLAFENGGSDLPATQLVSGLYRPSATFPNDSLPAPAPLGTYGTTLPSPTAGEANGIWQLYAADDFGGESGHIEGVDLMFTVSNGVGDPSHAAALPDVGTMDFPIPIGGIAGAIAQVTVRLSLSHPQTAALDVSLAGPDGTEVDLSSGNGAGASFGGLICQIHPGGCFPIYTTFDDGGGVAITDGVNPFTGAAYRPEQPLSAFVGKYGSAANGIWRLRVRDRVVGGIGGLIRVEISVREGAPVATSDSYATAYQTPMTVAAPGVLANDDAQGSEFEARLVAAPAHGTLALADDGGFLYTPAPGFVGVDVFTYRPMSREAPGAVTSVSIAVANPVVPQPPAAVRVLSVAGNLVTLRWSPPAVGPAPTGYLIEGGLAPGQTAQTLAAGPAPVLTFAAPRGSFFVRVRTMVGTDVSAPSNEVPLHVEVAVPPSPPAGLTAVVHGSTLSLAWRNTFEGGAPLGLQLNVAGTIEGAVALPLQDTATFTNVPSGVYDIVLQGVNAAGSGGKSNSVQVAVPNGCTGAPLPPTNLLAYRIGSTVHVIWDGAASGAAATSFQLAVSGSFVGGLTVPARSFSAPAPPGTYSISVAAVNACGVSSATAPVSVVVP